MKAMADSSDGASKGSKAMNLKPFLKRMQLRLSAKAKKNAIGTAMKTTANATPQELRIERCKPGIEKNHENAASRRNDHRYPAQRAAESSPAAPVKTRPARPPPQSTAHAPGCRCYRA